MHANLEPHLRLVLQGQTAFAVKGDAGVIWVPRKTLVDDIINGFPLKAPERETGVTNRFVTFGHTEARVEELTALIEAILERGAMSCKDAERLRERLQWFETFSHGRVAQQALKVVSGMASVGRKREGLGAKR